MTRLHSKKNLRKRQRKESCTPTPVMMKAASKQDDTTATNQ